MVIKINLPCCLCVCVCVCLLKEQSSLLGKKQQQDRGKRELAKVEFLNLQLVVLLLTKARVQLQQTFEGGGGGGGSFCQQK